MTEGCLLLPEPGQPNPPFPGPATQEGDGKFPTASPQPVYQPGDKCHCAALINSPGSVCHRCQERMVRTSPHFQPLWALPTSVQAGPAGQGGQEGGRFTGGRRVQETCQHPGLKRHFCPETDSARTGDGISFYTLQESLPTVGLKLESTSGAPGRLINTQTAGPILEFLIQQVWGGS